MDVQTKAMAGALVGKDPHGAIVYRGPSEKLYFHGDGCELWSVEGHYLGQMKKSVRNGEGKLEYKNGNVYDGTWSNGLKVGRGVMRYADGQTYEGTWKDGQWEDGVMRAADGSCRTVFQGNIIE